MSAHVLKQASATPPPDPGGAVHSGTVKSTGATTAAQAMADSQARQAWVAADRDYKSATAAQPDYSHGSGSGVESGG